MTKGKYAARAANRMAELDSELISDLREELAASKRSAKRLGQELEESKREQASEALRLGRQFAAEKVAALTEELERSRAALGEEKERCIREIFRVIGESQAKLPISVWTGIASALGCSDRLGQLLVPHTSHAQAATRRQRRQTAGHVKKMASALDQYEFRA